MVQQERQHANVVVEKQNVYPLRIYGSLGVSRAIQEEDNNLIDVANCPSRTLCKQRRILGHVDGNWGSCVEEDSNNYSKMVMA